MRGYGVRGDLLTVQLGGTGIQSGLRRDGWLRCVLELAFRAVAYLENGHGFLRACRAAETGQVSFLCDVEGWNEGPGILPSERWGRVQVCFVFTS